MPASSADVLGRALAGHLEAERVGDGVRPWRVPATWRRDAPAALVLMAEFAAGVRLHLRTDADVLHVDLDLIRLLPRGLASPAAPSVLAAEVDGVPTATAEVGLTGLVRELDDGTFARGEALRTRVALRLGGADGRRDVAIWLPHDSAVVLHGIDAERDGRPTAFDAAPRPARTRWLHHGSSISHGGSAWSPTGTWPVRAARAAGLDLTNLGFGGNAMLDPMTAGAIRDAEADVISLELGINIVAGDTMRERVFGPAVHGFLDRIRDGHPRTPVVVMTAIACPTLEDHPGPVRRGPDGRIARVEGLPAGRMTLADTRRLLRDVVEARSRRGEPITVLDGTELLGGADVHLLPDGLHPDDAGHVLIADRFVSSGAVGPPT